jgi:hypothetical protein
VIHSDENFEILLKLVKISVQFIKELRFEGTLVRGLSFQAGQIEPELDGNNQKTS